MAGQARQDTREKQLGPGVVQISYWRPRDGRPEQNADRVRGFAGVARL